MKTMNILKTLLKVGFATMIIFIVLIMMLELRDNCHITEKYRGFVHRDFNINVKLNHKIPVVFHNLKNYHLIMQELGKLNLKKNALPNE